MSPCHTVYGDAGNSYSSFLGTHCPRNSEGFLPLAPGTVYLRDFFEFNPHAGQNRGAEELIALGLAFGQRWELVDENLSFFASLSGTTLRCVQHCSLEIPRGIWRGKLLINIAYLFFLPCPVSLLHFLNKLFAFKSPS